MKKIALIFGIFFSGCSLVGLATQATNRNEGEQKICEIFAEMDFAFIKNGSIINDSNHKTLNNTKVIDNNTDSVKILDYDNGIVEWHKSKRKKIHTFKCPKLKVLDTTKETKSFAVNGGGFNDFNAKVTKEAHITQLVKDGEVVKNDIVIPNYTLEKISIVDYKGYIYKADSLYIKKMRNAHASFEKTFRNNLPCFEMNRKRYCDSDLVQVLGNNVMLRVTESGYGTVNYKIYFYNGKQPIAEASYEFYNYFRMNPPEVIGNHDLKKDEVPSARDLRLIDIRTFKEW